MSKRIGVIDCTDLYHPHQDVGDNFDILAAYGMGEIDLRAVILDTTERLRRPPEERADVHPNLWHADGGNRDPGFIPMAQCNFMFNRNVPAAVSPFEPLKSPEDGAWDVPGFQQQGIELFLRTLREADEPVDVLVFCSCRTVAAALNREPELLARKIRRLHLSIGASTGALFDFDFQANRGVAHVAGGPGYIEWNVALDPHAFVRLLRSKLPMSLYPCASEDGPFAYGRHNTYYDLGSLEWVLRMRPMLRNYLGYAFTRSGRMDYLRALEGPMVKGAEEFFRSCRRHPVWETAIWLEVSGRKLVRRTDGTCRIVRAEEVVRTDVVVAGGQRNCRITRVEDTGRFDFELTAEAGNVTIFDRGTDVAGYEAAMRKAVPEWYGSF